MDALFHFDLHYLIPAALIGIAVAVVMLVLRRKKDGVRPPYARGFLIMAILLFVFAGVTIIVIPLIYFVVMVIRFGMQFFFAALKSL